MRRPFHQALSIEKYYLSVWKTMSFLKSLAQVYLTPPHPSLLSLILNKVLTEFRIVAGMADTPEEPIQ